MKRKSVLMVFLLIVLILTNTGCGIRENKNEDKSKYTITMGETKSIKDTVELTIVSNKVVNKIEPENSSGYYLYYNAGEGYKFLDVIVDVKNISSQSITMMDIGKTKFKIDDKSYDATYMAEEKNGESINGYASSKSIDPLETVRYHVASKIENSVFEKDSTVEVVMNLFEREYIYTINIINNENAQENNNNSSTINLAEKGQEIKENEIITIDNNCEFTIKSNEFKNKIEPSAATGYYHYLNAGDGKVYLNIRITAKNLKNSAVKQDAILGNITAIYDGSYEYKCSKVVEKESGADLNTYTSLYDINPLESMEYYILAELPQEIQDSTKPLCVQFSISGKDYVYKIR